MKEVSLIDVCAIKNGYAFKSSEFKDSGTPLIRISSFNNGPVYFDDRTVYVENEYLESKSTFKVEKGDVLIALSGATTGKYGLYTHDKPSLLNQRVGLLKSGVSQDLDDKYFYFYLSVLQKEIFRKAGGAAQPNISTKEISEFTIPLPPLDQQKKIAAILDSADAYRQKTKALIEKYDELTQSLFLDMFGDPFTNKKKFPVFKLGELCNELFLGLTSKVEYVEKGGFPLVRAKDINKGVLSFEKVKYISEKQHRKVTARRITKRGDVLISKSGTLGTCAIVDSDREFTTYESIFTVRPKDGLLSNIFLVYLVRNEGFKLKLLGNKVGGTVAHLNLKMFRDFEFPLPNIQKQKKFTKRAQAIEAQKAQAQASLAQAEDLFNSLLQRAFKGELK